jgi:hypothetical protein
MATSIDKLLEGFPHQTLVPITGKPHYEAIATLTRKLNTNAASVQSELGGGALGHPTLTISITSYATLSDTAFAIPANPGPTPNVHLLLQLPPKQMS